MSALILSFAVIKALPLPAIFTLALLHVNLAPLKSPDPAMSIFVSSAVPFSSAFPEPAITSHVKNMRANLEKMVEERQNANKLSNAREKAFAYCNKVKPLFEIIREHADMLERYLPDNKWTLPKYRELLFLR